MIYTWQSSAADFRDNPPRMAILPLACLEPHGPHLPIGSDQVLIKEIAQRVAAQMKEPVFLLPVFPYGVSVHHLGQAGTVSLGYETLWAVVHDMVTSLFEHGIRYVVILNNHGAVVTSSTRPAGNFIVKTAVRQLNYEIPGLTAIWVQPFNAGRDALLKLFPSAAEELHAGEVETSILAYLAPELVGPPPADHTCEVSAFVDPTQFLPFQADTIYGRPGLASSQNGQAALDSIVSATAGYIERTFGQLDQIKSAYKGES